MSPLPARPRHIAVEGPMGVGKTALASKLAKALGSEALLETQGSNPFLEPFLKEPAKYAFQCQVFFALSRHQALQALRQGELFSPGTVTDFMLERERVFSAVHLTPHELSLYDRIYAVVKDRVPAPDLVVYLQARPDVLFERLRKRDPAQKPRVTLKDLEELCRVYNDFFFHYETTPLLVVNTTEVDVSASDEQVALLAREVQRPRAGSRHYIPR